MPGSPFPTNRLIPIIFPYKAGSVGCLFVMCFSFQVNKFHKKISLILQVIAVSFIKQGEFVSAHFHIWSNPHLSFLTMISPASQRSDSVHGLLVEFKL